MTVDELLARKKEVLAMRREEREAQERGEGESFNLFFLNEELADLNARLRSLRGAPKGGGVGGAAAMDRAQYRDWLASERDEELREARQVYIETVKSSAAVLTKRQKELFDLWRDGVSVSAVARRLGVNKSTASRTLARGKARMRREAERMEKRLRFAGTGAFDLADADAARAVRSCLTERQAACVYLRCGKGMSLRDCGKRLGVGHTAVLRAVQRGLRSLQNTFRCETVAFNNADALIAAGNARPFEHVTDERGE